MRAFARLYTELDLTTATHEKVAALVRYFRAAPPADAAWAVHFLIGRRPKGLIGRSKLRAWAAAEAGIADWLFEESQQAVGDLAETITLLLPDSDPPSELPLPSFRPSVLPSSSRPLAYWVEQRLLPLRDQDEAGQRRELVSAWRELARDERYVWNKLITGSFRVGASARLVVRALSQVSGVDEGTVAHRLMGAWEPTAEFFERLVAPDTRDADLSRPYPFYLAHPLEEHPSVLGEPGEWLAEWKWDGIRAQLLRRAGRTFLWSRGEELLSGRFPEVEEAGALLPDGTVIDGELLPWTGDTPLPFAQLQRRIGRKTLGRKILSEVPVVLVCYDLLEERGIDLREQPFVERRERLDRLLRATGSAGRLRLSPAIEAATWDDLGAARGRSRACGAEGLMLKRRASPYGVGRRRGDWWKWKLDPHSIDAVLMYAQPGSGRRAGLYTDCTFGVWDGPTLVPFAKAYTGLTDEEIRKVDAFVRRNTIEKFGPVRTVRPELVFELAFEGIQRSTRHKSGVAVRFPRIARWRTDKRPEQADTLETVRALIDSGSPDVA
ncbi:MAG TPA: ATP-dependent DNA ligase [Gemmatimonadales bacterium]|nr:ATP-dependent DNA ligase [Gemmatimonadales bacterium]